MELGRIANRSRKEKCAIRRWRLDMFTNEEVKVRYQEALKATHTAFQRALKIRCKRALKDMS